jgi:RNA polymerase sigma-70 factor (ECF subfamily)
VENEAQRFPTTRWSIVIAARGSHSGDARHALAHLFETYWYPVYVFIRRRAKDSAAAEDLTQGFFASLLDRCSLDTVRPELGRFRAFLLASAKHYLAAERARDRAQKRGGGNIPLSLDFSSADRRYRLDIASEEDPESQYERQWALAVLDAAEEKLRRHFAEIGKAIQFEAFRPYLTADDEAPSYAELAAGLEMTEASVKVAVHRARRRFGKVLRDQIAETIAASPSDPSDWERAIKDEIRYLFRVLGR